MTGTRQLSDEERIGWLQLARTENVGSVTFHRLISRFGSAKQALEALPALASGGGARKAPRAYPRDRALQELEQARNLGAQFVAAGETGYPDLLRHIHGAPPLLCVSGNLDLARRDSVAIVGARNASAIGRKFTRMLAERLATSGIVVASGLARGIDTAAHEAALPHQTAAVVAGGIDYFYPPENRDLQKAIGQQGLLLSEMAPGTTPKAEHFPRRNRIISGMARAVIVVEAALHSGSLITARFAAEQGRDVYAVPGSPLDPRCAGTNRLIRDGATILTAIDDVFEGLQQMPSLRQGHLFETSPAENTAEAGPEERSQVLSLLSHNPVHTDDLIRESGLGAPAVAGILLELEVAGRISRSSGGMVALLG